MASRSLGKVEAYLTVREILSEVSKGANGVLWGEFSGLDRFRFAALGLTFYVPVFFHVRVSSMAIAVVLKPTLSREETGRPC